MFEEIGFWEALQLKIVTPLGLGGFSLAGLKNMLFHHLRSSVLQC